MNFLVSISYTKKIVSLTLLILCSGSLFYSINSTFLNICLIFCIAFILPKKFSFKPIIYAFIFISFFYFFHFTTSSLVTNLTLFTHIIFAYFTSKLFKDFYEFNFFFVNYFKYVIIISLVGFVLTFFLSEYYSPFYFFTNTESNYLNFFFFYRLFDIENTYRNISIFWEPGIYTFFLAYYLYSIYSIKNFIFKNKFFLLLIGYTALLSTYSSSILPLSLIFIYKYHSSFHKYISIKKLIYLIFILFAIIISFYFDAVIIFISELSISKKARIYDITLAINLILSQPFFGYGFSSEIFTLGTNSQFFVDNSSILEFINLTYIHERGLTNGIFNLLGYFGFIGGGIFIYFFFKKLYISKLYLLCIIIIFLNFTQPILFFPFIMILYFLNDLKTESYA